MRFSYLTVKVVSNSSQSFCLGNDSIPIGVIQFIDVKRRYCRFTDDGEGKTCQSFDGGRSWVIRVSFGMDGHISVTTPEAEILRVAFLPGVVKLIPGINHAVLVDSIGVELDNHHIIVAPIPVPVT